jgi:hypothetical protein
MAKRPGGPAIRHGGDQDMRDQEVVRANKELAAYFKGRRTEREARAALKIIKAFVRDRERRDAKSRAPLPGVKPAKASRPAPKRGTPKRNTPAETIGSEVAQTPEPISRT